MCIRDRLTSDKFYHITQENNACESVLLANLSDRRYKYRKLGRLCVRFLIAGVIVGIVIGKRCIYI